MAVSAITALATITLGSAQAKVAFSSISQSFRDLRLVASNVSLQAASSADHFAISLNYNFAGSYGNSVIMNGDGVGTTASTSYVNQSSILCEGVLYSLRQGSVSNYVIDIMDYSTSDKHKAVLSRSGKCFLRRSVSGGKMGRYCSRNFSLRWMQ